MQNSHKENNELDLLDVIGKVGRLFWLCAVKIADTMGKLIVLIGRALRYCLRKTLWFAAFAVVALIFNKTINQKMTHVFSNTISIRTNAIDISIVKNYIDLLTSIAPGDSAWKSALNLPSYSDAKKIVSIKACWGIDYNYDGIMDEIDYGGKYIKPLKWDTTLCNMPSIVMKDKLYIVSVVLQESVIPMIHKGIEENIRSNPYLQNLMEINKNAIISEIQSINYQIKLLDSLQKAEYFAVKKDNDKTTKLLLQSQGQVIALQEKDQRYMHAEVLNLHGARIALEKRLAMPDIEILGGSSGVETFSRDKINLMYAMLLAFLAAIIWDNRRWLIRQILSPFRKQE